MGNKAPASRGSVLDNQSGAEGLARTEDTADSQSGIFPTENKDSFYDASDPSKNEYNHSQNHSSQEHHSHNISSTKDAFANFRDRISPKNLDPDTKEKVKAGLFLGTLTGLSMLGGFGTALAMAKRQDPNHFAKGLSGSREIPESGFSLASRALARGTMCSVVGVGLICFTVWKMLGVHNLTEFRLKVGSMMPVIPKSENPGRGDFRTIRDLFQFIIDEDEREKREGKTKASKPS